MDRRAHGGGRNARVVRDKVSKSVWEAALLLVLAATYSPVSQLNLSPVYGAIPASIYHQYLTLTAISTAMMAKTVLPKDILLNKAQLTPFLAFSIPTIQFFSFQQSSRMGATYGPLVTEALTYFPLVFLSIFRAGTLFDLIDLKQLGEPIRSAGPSILSYVIFSGAQKVSTLVLKRTIGCSLLLTRSGLMFVLATLYALMLPSRMTVLAILPLLHSAFFNVHIPLVHTTGLLNTTLHANDYSLVARQESLTGYISVIDNIRDGFRVMRCDHSLLGGEWLHIPASVETGLREPIYAVFAMLEAVRLVQPVGREEGQTLTESQKSALLIGLGIGTTPSALMAHGINTTVVEIDPVVYDFAITYFGLAQNHVSVIEDATTYVETAQQPGHQREHYDYIIHDVFTGGAEPAALFTTNFLKGLSHLLKPDGVIAINYAGDLLLPSARIVIITIKSVFPTCRIFREAAPLSLLTSDARHDFTNVVVFCTKESGSFEFRRPIEADFLGSGARLSYLLPQHEIDGLMFERRGGDVHVGPMEKDQTHLLDQWQRQSAVGHWEIMRTVLPNVIWENW